MRGFLIMLGGIVITLMAMTYWPSTDKTTITKASTEGPNQGALAKNEESKKKDTSPTQTFVKQVIEESKKDAEDEKDNFKTGLENLAPSLSDTDVDGGFTVDDDGQLVVTQSTRELFDYFLSAQGEESLPTILRRIRAYINNNLPEDAAAKAEELLDTYVEYMGAAEDMDSYVTPGQELDLVMLRDQKGQLAALRNEYFDASAKDAFFAEEENYDEYTMSRMEILEDDSLSASEKSELIEDLQNQLPEDMRESIRSTHSYQNLRELTDDWQKNSSNAEELHELRSKAVGEEAANRLADLDKQKEQWQERVDSWQQERERVLNNGNLSDEDKADRIEALRAEHFDEREQKRVKTLEKRF